MKKALIIIAVIFFSILIIDRIASAKLAQMYENNFCKHSGGDLNYYLKFQNADTIFLGSSRVSTMINTDLIGKNVLNVASKGKYFYYNSSVIHLMEKYKKLPRKVLILNLEAEDIYIENKSDLIDNVFYLKYYYDKVGFIKDRIDSKSPFEKYKFLLSSYKFNGENFLLATNQLQSICDDTHDNYTPLYPTIYDSIKVLKGKKTQQKIKYTKFNDEFLKILQATNLVCRKNNLRLIIIYGPHYYYPQNFERASFRVKSFCKNNHIPYIDFNTNQFSQFRGIDSWVDIFHLNKKASLLYTKILNEELKKVDSSIKRNGNKKEL